MPLGQFEGEQDAATDLQGVLDGLQAGSQGFPLRVTKVSVRSPGRDNEIVKRKYRLIGNDATRFQIELPDLLKQHFSIGMRSQYPADWCGYFSGRQSGGRDLVEQGLKSMVVLAVHDGDLNGQAGKVLGSGEAPETGSYYYDSRSGFVVHKPHYRDSKHGR